MHAARWVHVRVRVEARDAMRSSPRGAHLAQALSLVGLALLGGTEGQVEVLVRLAARQQI